MSHRTAKLALLVASVVLGLSPWTAEAQQRESKPEGPAQREKPRQEADRKETVRKEQQNDKKPVPRKAARKKAAPEKELAADGKIASPRTAKERISITPEREAAVMTFVRRNHAELAELLAHLKENQPKEYERAIRELFRTSERLTLIHDRDREQYDLEVQLWKTQSRIQLLTARLQMGDSDELRGELRELLGEQIDNRAALLRHDREKAAKRLAKIEDDLQRLESDREKVIERQLQSLTGAGKAKRPAGKAEPRRTAKGSAQDGDADNGK